MHVGEATLTHGELEAQANRLARLFGALGLKRGDHVAAILLNSPFALVMAWAAWRSGLYYTPLATTVSLPDAARIIGNCRARLVVADPLAQTPWQSCLRTVPRWGTGSGMAAWCRTSAP